MSKIEMRF